MAAAFAGVAGGFGVNVVITPTDAVLTEITNDPIHLVDPARSIDITANLYFAIGSTILLTVLLSLVSTRLVEPRLGAYDSRLALSGLRAARPGADYRLDPLLRRLVPARHPARSRRASMSDGTPP
jgi:p-aminobenzoyl-glutamate transporter AbgT